MASCAYPTSAARSNLWSFNVNPTLTTPFKGRTVDRRDEEINKEVLDFAKLENDIMKNVLGEEEKRLELKAEESNNTFPSFNYVPPPIPHSFLKSNPILKLYPRDFLTSVNITNKQNEVYERQRASNQTAKKCFRVSNDRHRLQYPDPLPQIPEVQHASSGHSVKMLLDRKTSETKPRYRLPPTNVLTYTSSSIQGTHQYVYTPSSNITYDAARFSSNLPQYFYTTAQTTASTGTAKSDTGGNGFYRTESKYGTTQPITASKNSDEVNKVEMTKPTIILNSNLPIKVTPKNVETKSNPMKEETVKTFAQIVATSKPAHAKSDSRYHE